MGKKEFLKSVINSRNSYVHVWHLVVSWACEVTEIVTQRSTEETFCVRITMTSQAQLATKYQI